MQRLRRSDGTYRWFQNNGFPLRDAAGEIARWCVLLTDIDERKRAEDALRESERESRLIVDSIPGLVATFTPAGEVEFVNRQVLDYFGKTLEELKHWETGDATHPEDLPRVVEHFTRAIASGDPFEFEVRARRFDGVYRWFQSRGFPLRDTNGHIVRWYNLLIDIDERKRAEEAHAASERNLKLTIDTIPALAWSARPDGSAEFFNQHFLDFIGLSAEQASGWGWTAAVHADDLNGLAATWQHIIGSEAPGEAEARLRRYDGTYRWFLFRANPLRDESGAIVQWYGVNTDIEDRKRAEAELRRAYDSFADAQRLSKTGSFITDLVGDDHNWSEETYRIFEFEPGTKVTLQRIQASIHPDDLPSFESMIARACPASTSILPSVPERAWRREACARDRPCHRADRGSADVRRRPTGRDREHDRGRSPEQSTLRARACGAGHHGECLDGVDRPRDKPAALRHHHQRRHVSSHAGSRSARPRRRS